MATPGTIITVQEIVDTMPDLKLKLENKAKTLKEEIPEDSELIQKAKEQVQDIFEYAESDINLEELASKTDCEEELDAVFARIHDKVDESKDDIKKKWNDMTDDDKKEVITFWKAVGKFLRDVVDWLGAMFNVVLQKNSARDESSCGCR